jgi:hypothetical protein
LRSAAQEALKEWEEKQMTFQHSLALIKTVIEEKNITQMQNLIFSHLGGLWTIYGFTDARDLLLRMDSRQAFSRYSEAILSNLRFRPDDAVFAHFNFHLRDSYDILKQSLSLDALLEPWWMEENVSTQYVLRDFLERLSKEKILDYLELAMAVRTANVLLKYSSPQEKLEVASLALGLLDKFPPRPDAQTIKLYHQIVWMVGEALKK